MVFDYWGEDISQGEIADVARTDLSEGGTYGDELLRAGHFSNLSTSQGDEMPGSITGYAARKLGCAAFEQWDLTIADLKSLIDRGEPVILLMWWSSMKIYGHFRVVVGYTGTQIIMHDPWRLAWGGDYGGENVSMPYSTFEDLWDIYGNWGLLVRPFEVEVQMPTTVICHTIFEVNVRITYPCPPPFNQFDYSATSCNVTIYTEEGSKLASGETAKHSLGNINARSSVETSWLVNATKKGVYHITILSEGIVEGNVWGDPPYDYKDRIGGSSTISLRILNIHDIRVDRVILLETIIVQGYELCANATVANIGTYPETFNVTAYLNSTIVHQELVSLTNGTATTITFQWNTTNTSPGNYLFSIHASEVPGETDTSDNTYEYGTVTIKPQLHDVGITSITVSRTSAGEGYDLKFHATVKNLGNVMETFILISYVNATTIETTNVTLTDGESTTLTFVWETTGFVKGNYTIWADIPPLPLETNTTDNRQYAGNEVCLTIPGDVDADFDVDLYDAVKLLRVLGVKEGDPDYNPNLDINNNGQIFYDAVILISHYGDRYP